MSSLPLDISGPTAAVLVLAVAIGGTIVVAGATGGAAFDPFNPGWEGLSDLRETGDGTVEETHLATDIETYDDLSPAETLALIVQPGEYTPDEHERLRAFVDEGGTVVVAARDPVTSTPLLEALGTDVRVDGDPLRDEREYWITPDFPLVADVADHTYVGDATGMSLNHGTALVVRGDADTLATTSSYSYLDRDGEGRPTESDTLTAHPVVATEDVGNGAVVVVSDPSIFINAMMDRPENRAFASALLAEHDALVLDRTADGVPPLVSLVLALRESVVLSGLLVLAVLGLVYGFESRRVPGPVTIWQTGAVTDETGDSGPGSQEASLGGEHVERGRDRLERALGGVFTRQGQGETNE